MTYWHNLAIWLFFLEGLIVVLNLTTCFDLSLHNSSRKWSRGKLAHLVIFLFLNFSIFFKYWQVNPSINHSFCLYFFISKILFRRFFGYWPVNPSTHQSSLGRGSGWHACFATRHNLWLVVRDKHTKHYGDELGFEFGLCPQKRFPYSLSTFLITYIRPVMLKDFVQRLEDEMIKVEKPSVNSSLACFV